MASELFPDAQHILHLFHLKENVYEFAKNKFDFNENSTYPGLMKYAHFLKTVNLAIS